MTDHNPLAREVDQFIADKIDTVPHLEALLLAWNKRPKAWSAEEMGEALYLTDEAAEKVLNDLVQQQLLEEVAPKQFRFRSSPQHDDLMVRLDATYRRELIRVTRMIHAKAPSALRDFARAFRFTREKK
jgi:predicted ArsR family transcriptional regulator